MHDGTEIVRFTIVIDIFSLHGHEVAIDQQFDILVIDFDIVALIRSALFVKEAQRVTEFVGGYARNVTAWCADADFLSTPSMPNKTRTPIAIDELQSIDSGTILDPSSTRVIFPHLDSPPDNVPGRLRHRPIEFVRHRVDGPQLEGGRFTHFPFLPSPSCATFENGLVILRLSPFHQGAGLERRQVHVAVEVLAWIVLAKFGNCALGFAILIALGP